MKIRDDFVTNSSSSSFIVHKRAKLCSKDGKTEIYFDSTKIEGEKSEVDFNAPLFKEFISEQYLNTGKKIKPENLASSEKALKEYVAFLNARNPGKYAFAGPPSFIAEESKRESGEFCGGALENFWFACRDCFHPQLRKLIGEQWSLFDYYQDIRFLHYAPCYVEKKCGKVKYNYVRFFYDDPKTGIRYDDTERFFKIIFERFDKPDLDIDEMAPHLTACGLSQNIITSIEERGYRVMYCSNKTGRNDKGNSIVLIEPSCEDVNAVPIFEYMKK